MPTNRSSQTPKLKSSTLLCLWCCYFPRQIEKHLRLESTTVLFTRLCQEEELFLRLDTQLTLWWCLRCRLWSWNRIGFVQEWQHFYLWDTDPFKLLNISFSLSSSTSRKRSIDVDAATDIKNIYGQSMAVLLESHAPHLSICPLLGQKFLVLVNLDSLVLKGSPVVLAMSKLVGERCNLSGEDESWAVRFWEHADSRVVFFLGRELYWGFWFETTLK